MSYQQVGAALGIADTSVRETELRALKKLRRILARRLGADYFGSDFGGGA